MNQERINLVEDEISMGTGTKKDKLFSDQQVAQQFKNDLMIEAMDASEDYLSNRAKSKQIKSQMNSYQQGPLDRQLSPERVDGFATPNVRIRATANKTIAMESDEKMSMNGDSNGHGNIKDNNNTSNTSKQKKYSRGVLITISGDEAQNSKQVVAQRELEKEKEKETAELVRIVRTGTSDEQREEKKQLVPQLRKWAESDNDNNNNNINNSNDKMRLFGTPAATLHSIDDILAVWNGRMASERHNHRILVEKTVEMSEKVGANVIINKIAESLHDENELVREMAIETIDKILSNQGVIDIDEKLEETLIDGILYAFQEQSHGSNSSHSSHVNLHCSYGDYVVLNGFDTIVNTLGVRCRPYLPQICGIIKYRMKNDNPRIRQQVTDLIVRIAPVLVKCGNFLLLRHLSYDISGLNVSLGEGYDDVLESVFSGTNSHRL